jgi:hypothetical protein
MNATLTDPGWEPAPKGERTAVRAVHQGAKQICSGFRNDLAGELARRGTPPGDMKMNPPRRQPPKIIGARRGAGSVNTYRVFPGN